MIFETHHENVLGTSLELVIRTDDENAAERAEQVTLAEIQRWAAILSSYDPMSELEILGGSTRGSVCRFA